MFLFFDLFFAKACNFAKANAGTPRSKAERMTEALQACKNIGLACMVWLIRFPVALHTACIDQDWANSSRTPFRGAVFS